MSTTLKAIASDWFTSLCTQLEEAQIDERKSAWWLGKQTFNQWFWVLVPADVGVELRLMNANRAQVILWAVGAAREVAGEIDRDLNERIFGDDPGEQTYAQFFDRLEAVANAELRAAEVRASVKEAKTRLQALKTS